MPHIFCSNLHCRTKCGTNALERVKHAHVRVSLQLYFRVGTVHSIYNYVVNEIPLCRSNEDKIWILPDFKHAAKNKAEIPCCTNKIKEYSLDHQ